MFYSKVQGTELIRILALEVNAVMRKIIRGHDSCFYYNYGIAICKWVENVFILIELLRENINNFKINNFKMLFLLFKKK